MTCNEFLSTIRAHGATVAPPAPQNQVGLTNTTLQQMRCAMLPSFMFELYGATGGINCGTGYIFGPTDIDRGALYPIPSIVHIAQDFINTPSMHGKTIFGRNDLFFFAFDAFGTCFMLDNLSLRPLRKYDDPYRALTDCLAAGKI